MQKVTYKITKESEYVKDMEGYYLLTRNNWDGNLEIDLDKLCVVEGDQFIDGYNYVSGYQLVRGNQDVRGNQEVRGYQLVRGNQLVSGNQDVRGNQEVRGYQLVRGNQLVSGNQDVSGYQLVSGYQKITSIVKAFNSKWWYYIKIDTLKIGCKEMSWKEWDIWFAGDEVFTTERNTKEFEIIQNGFECAKVMRNQLIIQQKYVEKGK